MTQGKSVYNLLSTAITGIVQLLVTQQHKLSAARKEQTDLNKALSENYKKLAGFYLAVVAYSFFLNPASISLAFYLYFTSLI